MTYTTREPTTTHTTHATRSTREQNKMQFALRKRTLSPARHILEDTSHQIRLKIDAGDASLLMGSGK
jgi:hydrogenase maturation factor